MERTPLAPTVPRGRRRAASAIVVGMPEAAPCAGSAGSRAPGARCRSASPTRDEVAQAFDAADVALVVDGGRREGPPPTLVDATVSPVRVLREGALPASFVEGTMLMSKRRRWLSRSKRSGPGRTSDGGPGGTSG